MITLNLNATNPGNQLKEWGRAHTTTAQSCDECGRRLLTQAGGPAVRTHVVKIGDGTALLYALCEYCDGRYEEHRKLYRDEGPQSHARVYVLPNVSADAQRISDRLVLVLG
jgi:hypothetical protein